MVALRHMLGSETVAIVVEDEGDGLPAQDLVTAAVNEALNRGQDVMKEEVAKLAGGLGLPPGLI